MGLTKFVAPEIIFGKHAIRHAGEACLRLGARHVLIVSDRGVVQAGWTDHVIKACRESNLQYSLFFELTTNPKSDEVESGFSVYRENGCDAVIGLGGGSALDVAKAIAVLASNGGAIAEYEGVDKISSPLPPMVMISTTAGSGSEVSQFSVINDPIRKKKMTIVSKSLVPDIAIIDPKTLATKESDLTASTGMDVLTHAIEAYVSIASTPLTTVHAKNAIQLAAKFLRPSVAQKANEEAKEAMAMASLQAGLAFSNAILGAVHAIAHSIGGRYGYAHGDINAILLPHVMEYNFIASPNKFADIALLMGADLRGLSEAEAGKKAISFVKELASDIGAPSRLNQIGLKEEDILLISQASLLDACMITNPRDMNLSDVATLLRRAL